MLKTDLIKIRFLAFLTAGVMISAFLLNSFQSCYADKFFPQYRTHLISLAQDHLTDLEGNDCSHPQVDVCGILSGKISTDNLAPKKDSPLPFLLNNSCFADVRFRGMQISSFHSAQIKILYKNTTLLKLSNVILLI